MCVCVYTKVCLNERGLKWDLKWYFGTEFSKATAYLTDSGSLAEGGGEKKTCYLTGGKSIFQRKKSCCPWTLLTVQFQVYIFPLKGSDCRLYVKKCHSVIFIHSQEIFIKAWIILLTSSNFVNPGGYYFGPLLGSTPLPSNPITLSKEVYLPVIKPVVVFILCNN